MSINIHKKYSIGREIEIVTQQDDPDDHLIGLDVYHKRPNFKSGCVGIYRRIGVMTCNGIYLFPASKDDGYAVNYTTAGYWEFFLKTKED